MKTQRKRKERKENSKSATSAQWVKEDGESCSSSDATDAHQYRRSWHCVWGCFLFTWFSHLFAQRGIEVYLRSKYFCTIASATPIFLKNIIFITKLEPQRSPFSLDFFTFKPTLGPHFHKRMIEPMYVKPSNLLRMATMLLSVFTTLNIHLKDSTPISKCTLNRDIVKSIVQDVSYSCLGGDACVFPTQREIDPRSSQAQQREDANSTSQTLSENRCPITHPSDEQDEAYSLNRSNSSLILENSVTDVRLPPAQFQRGRHINRTLQEEAQTVTENGQPVQHPTDDVETGNIQDGLWNPGIYQSARILPSQCASIDANRLDLEIRHIRESKPTHTNRTLEQGCRQRSENLVESDISLKRNRRAPQRLNGLRITEICTGRSFHVPYAGGHVRGTHTKPYTRTCPLDNFLATIYLSLLNFPDLQMRCQRSSTNWWKVHYQVYYFLFNGETHFARQAWLGHIGSDLRDLYGTEEAMIHGHVKHNCGTSNTSRTSECTCYRDELSTGAIQLTHENLSSTASGGECLFQTMIDRAVSRDSASEQSNQRFPEEPPVFLTIDLSRVKERLGDVDAIPETVQVGGQSYRLAGVTLHTPMGDGHFSAMVMHNFYRWRYDNSVRGLTPFNGQASSEQLSFAVYRIDNDP